MNVAKIMNIRHYQRDMWEQWAMADAAVNWPDLHKRYTARAHISLVQ